jgi:hypothetical protein
MRRRAGRCSAARAHRAAIASSTAAPCQLLQSRRGAPSPKIASATLATRPQPPSAFNTSLFQLIRSDVNLLHQLQSPRLRTPSLSPDGYIRLSIASLGSVPLQHLYSAVDGNFLEELHEQTVPARSAGFCEWQSATAPEISIGWGWFVHDRTDRLLLAPDGVRSNIMLIDAVGYDLDNVKSAHLFYTWLSMFDWTDTVNDAIRNQI